MDNNTNIDLKSLNAFLRKNKSVDFRKANLRHKPTIEACNWRGLEAQKAGLLDQIRAYRRVLRVLPDDNADSDMADTAKALLKRGIDSALRIAEIPKKVFVRDYLDIFGGDAAFAERVHRRAIAHRKGVTLRYLNLLQRLEPHTRAAGLNR